MKLIMILGFVMLSTGCITGEGEARETLYKSGYTDVGITGVEPFACGKDDFMGQSFNAKNVQGMRVEGVVCCGMFKGCTVRF